MKYTTVSIPDPLNKKLRKIIKGTGFASTSSFVVFILREILIDRAVGDLLSGKEKIGERVKTQLRALGYLKHTNNKWLMADDYDL